MAKSIKRKFSVRINLGLRAAITGFLAASALVLGSSAPLVAQEHSIRVALYVDRGTEPETFETEFASGRGILCKKIDGDDIRNGVLKDCDALIIPGGAARAESYSMGPAAREEVRRFIQDGGIYMGVCAGAYLASDARDVYLKLLPLKTRDQEHWYRVDDMTPVRVEMTPLGMEVFGFNQNRLRIGYENGPIFAPPVERPDPSFTPLGFFRSEVVADGGDRGVMLGAPAMILSRYGRGLVLILSPHPEETVGMKRAEVHALRWLYDHRGETGPFVLSSESNSETANAVSLTPKRQEIAPSSSSSSPRIESKTAKTSPQVRKVTITKASSAPLQAAAKAAKSPSTNPQAATAVRDEIRQVTSPGRSNESILSEEAVKLAERTFDRANTVSYEHRQAPASRQVITDDDGTVKANTDCSGFISYIVHKIAPKHYSVVRQREPGASYPQAKVWARFFDTLDPKESHDGWLGISNWQDLQAGDFIAWKEGKAASSNTGHVMMVIGKPGGIREEDGHRFFEVPVIDSSSVYHFPPEKLPPNAKQTHRNGLGKGIIRIVVSEQNAPIGYWAGTYWGEGHKQVNGPTFSNLIRFARMTPLTNG